MCVNTIDPFLLKYGRWCMICSSPEVRLVRLLVLVVVSALACTISMGCQIWM